MEYNEDQELKIVLPAKDIPVGSTVTKAKGTQPHTLLDCIELKVYDIEGNRRDTTIDANSEERFITSDMHHFIAISGDTPLAFVTTVLELHELLDELREERESK